MKIYISTNGELFAYNDNGSQDHLIPPDYVLATQQQIDAVVNPVKTQDEIIASFEYSVQKWLDAFAQTWGYYSVVSAASYYSSTNSQFQKEAVAIISWRDAVWVSIANILAAIKSGASPMPASSDLFIAMLPQPPQRP